MMDLKSALDNWKACRALLTTAIQSYLTACADLDTACAQLLAQPRESHETELALMYLDTELAGLSLEEEELRNARVSLTVTRNLSTTLAPLHTLPPEILTSIFRAAQHSSCTYDTKSLPVVHSLAGVSSYWRRVAVNTPSLWTGINITTQTGCDYAGLLLLRSKDLPVSLYLFEPAPKEAACRYWSRRLGQASDFLVRASPKVQTLDVESWTYTTGAINIVLKPWLDHGSTTTQKILRIKRPGAHMFPDRLAHRWQFEMASAEHSDAVLRSITVLHLQEMVIPWSSTAYHGLIDLRLEFSAESEAWITVAQLAGTLAASPTLEILKIGGLGVARSSSWDTTISIPLVHLQVLYLSDMNNASWELLLPLFSLSDCLGSLSIGFRTRGQANLAHLIDDFLRNSPTETLVFSEANASGTSPLWALSISRTIPSLRNLVLSQFNLLDVEELETITAELGESNDTSAPHQLTSSSHSLTHLYMVSSDVNLDDLKVIVPMHSVRALHLECCTIFETEEANHPTSIGELKNSLLVAFPDLICVVSDADTTAGWPCRTMFDQIVYFGHVLAPALMFLI